MATNRKTPSLQGSINQIVSVCEHGKELSPQAQILVRFVAAQFGREYSDVLTRVESTLSYNARGGRGAEAVSF